MATGPEGGAYHEVGRRYRALLAHHGIELRLLATAGGLENLARLRDPRSGPGEEPAASRQAKASHLPVPRSYASLLYTLRMHIALVRERLERAEKAPIVD